MLEHRQPEMSVVERMARVRNVAWSRAPHGKGYWVSFELDGVPEIRTFRTARAASGFALFLDASGKQATSAELRAAEDALRDLEATVEGIEREQAFESLADLERTMRAFYPEPSRPVRVRGYQRLRRKR